jgi:MFS family permease
MRRPMCPDPDHAKKPVADATPVGGSYARYVLAVLTLVYVFNFLDRQILSILAERIKADLGISDAQMGFLYGTAFAVFYALFGIPLGRLADVWDRRRLISIGLAFWSAMTAVSGLARSFGQLAAARIGVGVGEASASPAAFSLLSDYFPPERRTTVLALYSSGIYIGAGLGLGIGGVIVEGWDRLYSEAPPLGLRGWQVAFFVVGLPGLLLSLWVRSLREPVRGQSEGLAAKPTAPPLRAFLEELAAVIPPLPLVQLLASGAGARAVSVNVTAAVLIATAAWALTEIIGNAVQWIALGIGLYAAVSWAQMLARRDPPAFALIFRTPSLAFACTGYAFLAFTGYGVGFWTTPYFIRVLGASESEVGLVLGGTAALSGWLGVTLGGVFADQLRRRTRLGRLQVGVITALLPLPFALWLFTTPSLALAFLLNIPVSLATSMWIGPGASTVQDLVLPRMRATASAAYLLVVTFIGLALGPYTIGRLSVAVGDLRTAILIALGANAVALVLLLLAMRPLARDEDTRIARAQAAGELPT